LSNFYKGEKAATNLNTGYQKILENQNRITTRERGYQYEWISSQQGRS
jgi:hypothetical protein